VDNGGDAVSWCFLAGDYERFEDRNYLLRGNSSPPNGDVTPLKVFRRSTLPLRVDERARQIERVYRERYVGFRNALATVTGSYESARDAVQEGFARALRERHRFRGDGPIEAWIFRIALRAALETGRNGREPHIAGDVPAALVDEAHDPTLAAALRALPPRRRLVVFLRYFADLSYAEIATALDISQGTVAASLAQAHEALREALRPEEVRQ
jgi:RNA polymerase sigma-70 factor (ECF subfamily)